MGAASRFADGRLAGAVGWQQARIVSKGGVAYCGFHADCCGAAGDDQIQDAEGPQLDVKVCLVEPAPSPLGDDDIARLWHEFGKIFGIPGVFDPNAACSAARGRDRISEAHTLRHSPMRRFDLGNVRQIGAKGFVDIDNPDPRRPCSGDNTHCGGHGVSDRRKIETGEVEHAPGRTKSFCISITSTAVFERSMERWAGLASTDTI